MNAWTLVGLGINLAVLFMAFVWIVAWRLNNAGWVDVAWSISFAPLVLFYAAVGGGDPIRRVILSTLVVIWSLRLGLHIFLRLMKTPGEEDPRYAELRARYPERTWLMFFGFFELQAVLIGVLSAIFAVPLANSSAGIRIWEILGVVMWLIAFGGESLSDWQLQRFRSQSENQGKVCNAGLWKYSRHPNYFFEWLIWVAYFLFACGSPGGWAMIFCPLLMLYFLTKVTGIPPAEAQALKSRGDAYRAYQRTTSAFVPWPPKET